MSSICGCWCFWLVLCLLKVGQVEGAERRGKTAVLEGSVCAVNGRFPHTTSNSDSPANSNGRCLTATTANPATPKHGHASPNCHSFHRRANSRTHNGRFSHAHHRGLAICSFCKQHQPAYWTTVVQPSHLRAPTAGRENHQCGSCAATGGYWLS